jgi:hypothetical protein
MVNQIIVKSDGPNAKAAFEAAKEQSPQIRGYSSFRMVSVPKGQTPMDFANALLEDPSIPPHLANSSDTLACINEGNGWYLFVAVVRAN